MSGPELNKIFRNFGEDGYRIKGILRQPAENADAADDKVLISDPLSKEPVYAWYDNDVINIATPAKTLAAAEDMSETFYYLENLTDISGLEGLDTSQTISMRAMFSTCSSLKDLSPVSGWDTSKVEDISHIFCNTPVNQIAPLANWNTSNVQKMQSMFSYTNVSDVSALKDWDVSNVRDMGYMFEASDIENLDALKNWDTKIANNRRPAISCFFLFPSLFLPSFYPFPVRYI